MSVQHILGIDVGGTKCAVVNGSISPDNQITLTGKSVFPTETAKGFNHTLDNIFIHIDEALSKSGLVPKECQSSTRKGYERPETDIG